MTINEDIGYLGPPSNERCEYLALSFSPLSAPLRSRWRNNGVSADFIGDYVTTFLPTDHAASPGHANRREIRHAVTYIANEFLENAMKYHQRGMDIPIGIRLELTSDQITISTSNAVSNEQAHRYRTFALGILSEDAGELLVKQLEAGSAGGDGGSCTGLLTMITDYGARLGWRFQSYDRQKDQIEVTTRAELALGELLEVRA